MIVFPVEYPVCLGISNIWPFGEILYRHILSYLGETTLILSWSRSDLNPIFSIVSLWQHQLQSISNIVKLLILSVGYSSSTQPLSTLQVGGLPKSSSRRRTGSQYRIVWPPLHTYPSCFASGRKLMFPHSLCWGKYVRCLDQLPGSRPVIPLEDVYLCNLLNETAEKSWPNSMDYIYYYHFYSLK